MSLPKFATRYRITVSMIFLAIAVIGFISLSRLKVSLLPSIEFPKITVLTEYPNAAPLEIRDLITRPLEEALSSVSGIKKIESNSKEGLSIITLSFEWGSDMDLALLNIGENTDRVRAFLPQDAQKPIILKFDPGASPVVILSVVSEGISENYLKRYIDKEIKPRLERIRGVGSVTLTGGRETIIDIEADSRALFSYKIGLKDLMNAVGFSNVDFPAGNIEQGDKNYLVRTLGRFKSIDEIEKTIVKVDEKGVPVYLGRVARVKNVLKERESVALVDAKESIVLEIKKEASENTVLVCEKIKEAVEELKEKHRGRIKISQIYDESKFIQQSISDVSEAAVTGCILAFLVLLFFLRELKASIIIVLSIPIAVLATFVFMYLAGISFNMMSLGGLAIGAGILVDNSIVVLENINRLRLEGCSVEQSCVGGAQGVQLSIWGATLTTIVVFLPMIFLKGLIGALFREMAFTLTFSLLSSILVANLLVPMLASVELSNERSQKRKFIFFENLKNQSKHFYQSTENGFLRLFDFLFCRKKTLIGVSFLMLIPSFILLSSLDKELMPQFQERTLNMWLKLPEGTPIETTRETAMILSRKIKELNFVKQVFVTVGADEKNLAARIDEQSGKNKIQLKLFLDNEISIDFAVNHLNQIKIKGVEQLVISRPQDIISKLISNEERPILIQLEGKNTQSMKSDALRIADLLNHTKGIQNAALSTEEGKTEIKIKADAQKLSAFGLNLEGLGRNLKGALEGEIVSKYYEGDNSFPIRIRLHQEERNGLDKLKGMLIPSLTTEGLSVPLSKIASIETGLGSDRIMRENQADIIQIKADFDKNVYSSYSEAKKTIEEIIGHEKQNQKNKDIFDIKLMGENERLKESFSQLIFMFLLSVVFIYMIIASLFESLVGPLILMLSVPLGVIGVAAALFMTGQSINIMSGMGMILLSGIVIREAVILQEFIEQKEREGQEISSAIYEAVKKRLRPILMSAVTNILGLLPLALALSKGSEVQQPLAISVIGGLFASSFLTLFLIPSLYYLYKTKLAKKKKRA